MFSEPLDSTRDLRRIPEEGAKHHLESASLAGVRKGSCRLRVKCALKRGGLYGSVQFLFLFLCLFAVADGPGLVSQLCFLRFPWGWCGFPMVSCLCIIPSVPWSL